MNTENSRVHRTINPDDKQEVNKEAKGTRKTGRAVEAELYNNKYNKENSLKYRKLQKEKEKLKIKIYEAFKMLPK